MVEQTDLEKLDEIEKRAARSAPAPWYWSRGEESGNLVLATYQGTTPGPIILETTGWPVSEPNAAFIAFALEDVKYLASEVRRLNKLISQEDEL